MLTLSRELVRQIGAHGEATYPEECGGLLIGTCDGDHRVVIEIMPLENKRTNWRRNRVELSPQEFFQADRDAGRRGLGVWGFYHSHPDHPAVPSEFDLEHAGLTNWSYVIVKVAQGHAAEIRSWNLRPDRSSFIEETIENQL